MTPSREYTHLQHGLFHQRHLREPSLVFVARRSHNSSFQASYSDVWFLRTLSRLPSSLQQSIRSALHILRAHQLSYQQLPSERSEEHTSELQSRENLVCRLLL